MKTKLQVSVSGGRTSAYMAWWLKQHMSDQYEMIFLFANTGLEHPDTYRFLREVDTQFELDLVLLECVIHHNRRKAASHKVVTYETLSRNGEPFEAFCSKYGVPNHTFKGCTREMKANTMQSYTRSIWGKDYDIAIGIRADETRRVSVNALKNRIVYPLIDMNPTTKKDVLDFFKQYSWDLKIPDYLGNCVTCYKKSDRKLAAVYRDNPEYFDFFRMLEAKYGHILGPNEVVPGGRRVIFRGYRSTVDLCEEFSDLDDEYISSIADKPSVCDESCEPYPIEG